MPQAQGRGITQADLRGQFLRGFALTNPTQQQHDLHRRQMRLLKDRAAVQIVGRPTRAAAIRRQITTPRAPKHPRLVDRLRTPWTLQLTRMKMFEDPSNAIFVIEEMGNREFHVPSLPAPHTFVR